MTTVLTVTTNTETNLNKITGSKIISFRHDGLGISVFLVYDAVKAHCTIKVASKELGRSKACIYTTLKAAVEDVRI